MRSVVYDLLADKRTVKIKAHEDDINSCCWADTASGNVLVSASDDTFLKVWYVIVLLLFAISGLPLDIFKGSSLTWIVTKAVWGVDWPH